MGGKTILSLRGGEYKPPTLFEIESCAQLGLELENIALSARKAPQCERLLKLLDIFRTLDRPFLMHCKSGADRTGLASVLYLMVIHERRFDEVKDQLSFKYIHIRRTATGILDEFFHMYLDETGGDVPIEGWIERTYDANRLTQRFADRQARLKLWEGWR